MTTKCIFDIEVFKNYILIIFLNLATGELTKLKITSKKKDRNKLKDFFKNNSILIGYNNHKYDDKILVFLKHFNYDCTPYDIYCFSRYLIDNTILPGFAAKLADFNSTKFHQPCFKSIDLMKFAGKNISLKALGIAFKHTLIQELPCDFNKELTQDEMGVIEKYCENDVKITQKAYEHFLPKIEARETLNTEFESIKKELGYKKDFCSLTDSRLAADVMALKYCHQNGLKYYNFVSLKKPSYKSVKLCDIISADIVFETDELQKFLTEFKKQELKFCEHKVETFDGSTFETIKLDEKSFSESKLSIGEQVYTLGLGGLHSTSTNQVYKSKRDGQIVDVDVTSYYPAIITNLKIKQDWFNDSWLDIYKELIDQRVKAVNLGDVRKAEALKIIINSFYGNYNYHFFYAYDPKSAYTVTINGQLYLLMLIEQLELNGVIPQRRVAD